VSDEIDWKVLADGLQHPEGVAWDPTSRRVFAGGEGGQLYGVTLDGDVDRYEDVGESFLGIAVDGHGSVYGCDDGRNVVVRFDPDALDADVYSTGAPDEPFESPNGLAFDAEGNLYVTSSDNGLIMRVAPGGETRVWTRRVSEYPNGCAIGPDPSDPDPERMFLYVAESALSRIVRVPILPDGLAGAPETVADLPRMVPDGLALELGGDLYIACYRPDRIVRVSTAGEMEIVFDDWAAADLDAPTNIAFCGPELATAVVACVGDTFLAAADLGAFGAPVFRPQL